MAVLEGAAKPPIDHAAGSAGADDLAVALEPDFTGGVTGQVSALGVGQQRTQMQRGGALGHIDVHHHGGVVAVGPPRRLGVPAGLDQPDKRLAGAWQRGALFWVARTP